MTREVSDARPVPPKNPEADTTAQKLYEDAQPSSSTTMQSDATQPPSQAVQDLPELQFYFGTNGDTLDLNSSQQDRLGTVDPEMMGALLDTALVNEDAREILADISERDRITADTDPIFQAVQLAVKSHPELREQLTQAAIQGYSAQSNENVVKLLGDLAKKDPTFARALRGFVNEALDTNDGTFGMRQGVSLLMAMSSRWNRQDFTTALTLMAPDQVEEFRAAMKNAPRGIETSVDTSRWSQALQARLALVSRASQLNERQQAGAMNHAFPGYELMLDGMEDQKPYIDTRYITAALDGRFTAYPRQSPYSGIVDTPDSNMTPEQLFRSWGVEADQALIDQAVQNYGMDTVAAAGRRMAMYNALSPELREELTGSREPLSGSDIAGVIRNGKLGEAGSVGAFLVGNPPLEQTVEQKLKESRAALSDSEYEAGRSSAGLDFTVERLASMTRRGYSGLAMFGHALDSTFETLVGDGYYGNGFFTDGVEEFVDQQNELSSQAMYQRENYGDSSAAVRDQAARVAELRLAMDMYAYEQLRQDDGSQLRQDFAALAMLDRYGAATLQQSGRSVMDDLQNGGFDRLQMAGLIRNDEIPQFAGDNRSQQVEAALAQLRTLQYGRSGDLDLSYRRDAALTVLDSDPAMVRTQQIAAALGQDVATFSTLFQAGIEGTKGPEFVAAVKTTAASIEQAIQSVTAEDIQSMRALKESLEAAAYEAEDPATKLELRARLASVSGMLDIVDPQSENHQSLMETVRMAQTREFNEDNLANWFKENGPTIGVAAAAVAVIIACAPVGAPALAMVLASSATALAATQLSKEVLYLFNHYAFDTGLGNLSERSYAGAWVDKNWDTFGQLFSKDLGLSTEAAKDLMTSYLMEVAGPMGYEYAQNVVMGLVGLGALRVGQAGFSGLSKQWVSNLIRNPQSARMISEIGESIGSASANPTAAAFAKQWLAMVGKETGKEGLEETIQEGVGEIGQRILTQGGVNSTVASVLMAVAMGAGQGRMEGGFGRLNNDGSVNLNSSIREQTLADLQAAGQVVEQISDGLYSVRSYGNPNTTTLRFTEDGALLDPTAAGAAPMAEQTADGGLSIVSVDQTVDTDTTTSDSQPAVVDSVVADSAVVDQAFVDSTVADPAAADATVADTTSADSDAPKQESDSEADADPASATYQSAASMDYIGSEVQLSQESIAANDLANAILDVVRPQIKDKTIDEDTAKQYYNAAIGSLLPMINETALRLNLPPITADQIEFYTEYDGTNGKYNPAEGKLRLYIGTRDLVRVLDHEIQHMAKDYLRRAASQADPVAYRDALIDASLELVGNGGRRYFPSEDKRPDIRQTITDPEARQALSELVRKELAALMNPDEADFEELSMLDESMIPESLLAAFDGDISAVMVEAQLEAVHIASVIEYTDKTADGLTKGAKSWISKMAAIIRGNGTTPVTEDPLFRRVVLTADGDTMGVHYPKSIDYVFSPDELSSRKVQAAMELKRLKQQLVEAGINTPLDEVPQAQPLLARLQFATYQQQIALRFAQGDTAGAREYALTLMNTQANTDQYVSSLKHLVKMGLLNEAEVKPYLDNAEVSAMLKALRGLNLSHPPLDFLLEGGRDGSDTAEPGSMDFSAPSSMDFTPPSSMVVAGPVPPPSPTLDRQKFDDFSQSFDAWHDAALRRDQLQSDISYARRQAGSEMPRHIRAKMSREVARLERELEALNQEIPVLRETLDTKADSLPYEDANQFNREFMRESLEQQQILAQRMAEAKERGETATLMSLNTQMDAIVAKQGLQLRALVGPLAEIPDTTVGAMDNPQAAPMDRITEIDRLHYAAESPLHGMTGLEQRLADLQARGGMSRWWNKNEIQNLERQIAAAHTEMERLDALAMKIRQDIIADLPPGQTATIGRKGDVPIANGHFDNRHAQLTRLPDGSFELMDGFGGRPSGKGMGQNYDDLENYGTYVRRVNADGAVTYQQVSATEPTIVRAGDEIYLGYNPERNRGTSLSLRIVLPE